MNPQTFKGLIQGRGRGTPFLLLWMVGVFFAYGAMMIIVAIGIRTSSVWLWPGLLTCLLSLSLWESCLLFPTWRRRLIWIGLFAVAQVIDFLPRKSPMFESIAIGAVLHTFVLIGARRRVWVWAIIALFSYAQESLNLKRFLLPIAVWYDGMIGPFIPLAYRLPPEGINLFVAMTIQAVFLGIGIAYFMPRIEVRTSKTSGT